MLELNKEYTYKQIIKELGWKEYGGDSKKAQMKEIESAYNFYHPMNKKTHKEKKSYVFTEQLRILVEPSKNNCGGAHNTKNIKPMMDYIQCCLMNNVPNGEYYSMTVWLCDILKLLNKDLCNVIYQSKEEFVYYCRIHGIRNYKLLKDYILTTKFVLKEMFLKTLAYMEKNDMCNYHKGYIFVYKLTDNELTSYGTHTLNDLILENEIEVCNNLNEKYHLSDSKKDRQLLLWIYTNEDLIKKFNEAKVSKFIETNNTIEQLNKEITCDCSGKQIIDKNHHLINYYSGVSIIDVKIVEVNKVDMETLKQQITIIIRDKVQKLLYAKYYIDKQTNKRQHHYNINEHSIEMYEIEKLLFISNVSSINVAFANITLVDGTKKRRLKYN